MPATHLKFTAKRRAAVALPGKKAPAMRQFSQSITQRQCVSRQQLPSRRMRGKLHAGANPVSRTGLQAAGGEEAIVAGARLRAPLIAGLVAACLAAPSGAQDNIDAGKSPAQMFAYTCSACHRRPQELRRVGSSFLLRHYSPGSAEASAMAAYLAKVGSDPRAIEQRRRERAKAQQERSKAPVNGHATVKGRRAPEQGKAKTATAARHTPLSHEPAHEEVPTPPAEIPTAPPPRKVILEPFQE
jgi:hypothetical protein